MRSYQVKATRLIRQECILLIEASSEADAENRVRWGEANCGHVLDYQDDPEPEFQFPQTIGEA